MKVIQTYLPTSIVINFRIAQTKVQYCIPTSWTVNKTKCLLVTQFPKLKFDEFQLMFTGQLLKGYSKINSLVGTESQISLIVINAKSQIKFQEYYEKIMKEYLQFQHAHQPVMQANYQKTIKKVFTQTVDDKQIAPINPLQNNDQFGRQNLQNQRDLPQLFKVMRLIGLTMFISILINQGKIPQILFLVLVYVSHFLIDVVRARYKKKQNMNKNNQKANNQNINNQQNKNKNNQKVYVMLKTIKLKMLLMYYKSIQIILYFVLSFYPNWDLKLHFNIFGRKIIEWRNKINQMLPGAYPQTEKLNENVA